MAGLTLRRIEAIHQRLLSAGLKPGTKIPRRPWDELIVQSLGIGNAQARNITRDGDLHGYWTRHPHHGPVQGSVELRQGPTP